MRRSRHQLRERAQVAQRRPDALKLFTGNSATDAAARPRGRTTDRVASKAGEVDRPAGRVEPAHELDHLALGAARLEARHDDRDGNGAIAPGSQLSKAGATRIPRNASRSSLRRDCAARRG